VVKKNNLIKGPNEPYVASKLQIHKLKASQRNSKQQVMVYNASQSEKEKKKSRHEGPTKKRSSLGTVEGYVGRSTIDHAPHPLPSPTRARVLIITLIPFHIHFYKGSIVHFSNTPRL
jgi:hypothetical protein